MTARVKYNLYKFRERMGTVAEGTLKLDKTGIRFESDDGKISKFYPIQNTPTLIFSAVAIEFFEGNSYDSFVFLSTNTIYKWQIITENLHEKVLLGNVK
jgi:hypothetical protein